MAEFASPRDQRWTIDSQTRSRIDSIFEEFTGNTPGCAVGVYRNGSIEFTGAYGMSNLEHDIPVTPTSIFHVASISKQFTATCIALLDLEGVLSVNDLVRTWIPELPDYGPPITIRHLLHHSSGIRDQWTLLRMAGWRKEDLVTEDDCFSLIRNQRALNFPPNDRYMYSNSGYTLLAMIVRRATGLSLRRFAHERIFEPLGMTRTHFHDDHSEIVSGRTQAYTPRASAGYHISIPDFDVVGTTSLFTTVEDFAKWNGNFGTGQVGGLELLARMQSPGVFNDGWPMDYAWGLSVDAWRGQHRVGHDGADHGYRSCSFRLPDLDFGVTVFANLSSVIPRLLAQQVAGEILGELLDAEARSDNRNHVVTTQSGKTTSGRLACGAYTGVEDGLPVHLVIEERDGDLVLDAGDEPEILVPIDDGRYTLWSGTCSVSTTRIDASGVATNVLVTRLTGESTEYALVEEPAVDVVNVQDFSGMYYNAELDTSIDLQPDSESGILALHQRKFPQRACAWLGDDAFGWGGLGTGWRLDFLRDSAGIPMRVRLSTGRATDLEFTRIGQPDT